MRIKSRPRFDSAGDFVYLRPMTVAGRAVAAGDLVDKSTVTPRRLRQMYGASTTGVPEGAGIIAYAPGCAPPPPPRRPLAVGPSDNEHPGEARPPEKAPRRGVARRRSRGLG